MSLQVASIVAINKIGISDNIFRENIIIFMINGLK